MGWNQPPSSLNCHWISSISEKCNQCRLEFWGPKQSLVPWYLHIVPSKSLIKTLVNFFSLKRWSFMIHDIGYVLKIPGSPFHRWQTQWKSNGLWYWAQSSSKPILPRTKTKKTLIFWRQQNPERRPIYVYISTTGISQDTWLSIYTSERPHVTLLN